jgi:hypothetical protein
MRGHFAEHRSTSYAENAQVLTLEQRLSHLRKMEDCWRPVLSKITLTDIRLTANAAGMTLISWLLPVDELASAARKIRGMRGNLATIELTG